jgi:hypothetical protein
MMAFFFGWVGVENIGDYARLCWMEPGPLWSVGDRDQHAKVLR